MDKQERRALLWRNFQDAIYHPDPVVWGMSVAILKMWLSNQWTEVKLRAILAFLWVTALFYYRSWKAANYMVSAALLHAEAQRAKANEA